MDATTSAAFHPGPSALVLSQRAPGRWPRIRDGALAVVGYACFAVIFVVALPTVALVRLVTARWDPNRQATNAVLRRFAALVWRLCPIWHARFEGLERLPGRGPQVLVCNHESILDILLLSTLPVDFKWIAKASLFRVPWLGWMLELAGHIPVERRNAASRAVAFRRAADYVRAGVPVAIFPEGTRSRNRGLLPFTLGAFRLALETRAPIVPIALFGSVEGLAPESAWAHRTNARVKVLPPISAEEAGQLSALALRDRTRDRIAVGRAELAHAPLA